MTPVGLVRTAQSRIVTISATATESVSLKTSACVILGGRAPLAPIVCVPRIVVVMVFACLTTPHSQPEIILRIIIMENIEMPHIPFIHLSLRGLNQQFMLNRFHFSKLVLLVMISQLSLIQSIPSLMSRRKEFLLMGTNKIRGLRLFSIPACPTVLETLTKV